MTSIKDLIESKKSSKKTVCFKILIKDSKNVLVNGDFKKYDTFSKLTDKIIENLKTPFFLQNNSDINYKKKFKLVYMCDKEKNLFFPEELGGEVWDDRTYEILKNELLSKGSKDIKYKFYIENYDISEVLDKALDKYWDKAYNNITDELHLLKLEESNDKYKNEGNDQNNINQEHKDIICSNCFEKDIKGNRYICSECNNYNLCQKCEKLLNEKEIHDREHTFIQIKDPIQADDYFEYNNIIGNYCKEIKKNSNDKQKNDYKLDITVINNGKNDLIDCCILPVRYGEEYLFCQSKKITVRKGEPLKTTLMLKIPKIKQGVYKGYFRMFTPKRLPFGDVISVKLYL